MRIVEKVLFSIIFESHIDQVHYSITHYSVRIVEKVLFFKSIEAHIDQVHIALSLTTV